MLLYQGFKRAHRTE